MIELECIDWMLKMLLLLWNYCIQGDFKFKAVLACYLILDSSDNLDCISVLINLSDSNLVNFTLLERLKSLDLYRNFLEFKDLWVLRYSSLNTGYSKKN